MAGKKANPLTDGNHVRKRRRKKPAEKRSPDVCQAEEDEAFPATRINSHWSLIVRFFFSTSTSTRQVISACYRENIHPLGIITVPGPLVKHKQ